ncbi:SUMF1/EgtB/PvdO family nonheme iron enzyme [Pseudobacteriovorax antillogorgiicola]|uniref:Sulfatase-modifying factor enzyme-like domain-containing protein n=1 Tax=Pseudobacteriovorax antillogorgiicola TaxID=1513793 RepID=A0A1Y6BHY5_9BACT|nr:SUMF1/EgtB/PvdO family nonheme iron enzyme [Pseudobacteriovorax antillogorgiicola]TCS55537.1 hypothetical protein EDD56_105260 [Pseudobacteriovorax antillogorgiicola]SMF11217.1 hypothetical protein SAMN06296036_10564 [Pseudobacteriovorax antillogorgiicola]
MKTTLIIGLGLYCFWPLVAASKTWQETVRSTGASRYVGQGNPDVTKHPVSKEQCLTELGEKKIKYENAEFEAICGAKYMAPIYNPATESAKDAKACIDQFEYPNIPCEYPVVWVRASEAAAICEAEGKRICDAHEWEGACAGALLPPDYDFKLKGDSANATVKLRRKAHNKSSPRNWAYGPQRQKGICGGSSFKHEKCNGGNWKECGSNTYPAGYFPSCKSALEVYDQHGNAAEHMNLPLTESEMASRGSTTLGHTEMKGSWFIFDKYYAHQDWCRWRAPYWHGTKVKHPKSHHNYHLGFRCCKTVSPETKPASK